MAVKLFAVSGATGLQGGAVARHLLARGFAVRALTRNPAKAAALLGAGAQVVACDFNDRHSIARALEGAHGVFSVQTPFDRGVEAEVAQGTALAEASNDARIAHFVYSSVASAGRNTGIPHFESKWEIEKRIRVLKLPATILRPVYFMDNWMRFQGDSIRQGVVAQPLTQQTRLQQIAVDDIGGIAALAFSQPEHWIGRELEIAGDEPTMHETTQAFSQALGHPVGYLQVPWDQFQLYAGHEMTVMYRWFQETGYTADVESLRRVYPGLQTLRDFLSRQTFACSAN